MERYEHVEVTNRILNAAFEIHRALGPGLLESTYRACLFHELVDRGLHVEKEVPVAIRYKGHAIETAYRADPVVDGAVLVELKAVETLLPIHAAQILTYLKHARLTVGLLLNFNVPRMKHGVRRFARSSQGSSLRSPRSSASSAIQL